MTNNETKTTLFDLRGQVIELSLHFGGVCHGTLSGRVQFVAASPACWVGGFCFSPDLEVREELREPGSYSAHVRLESAAY